MLELKRLGLQVYRLTNIVAAVCSDIDVAVTVGLGPDVVFCLLAKRIDPDRSWLLFSELKVRFFGDAFSTLWMSWR